MVSTELALIFIGLFLVATLYSSVGHGGGSGYLAVLSLTSYGVAEAFWLKQYAWSLNLIVAGLAFWHYHQAGHHDARLTLPFVAASVPLAVVGGYMQVEGGVYALLLTVALLAAAWRLLRGRWEGGDIERPELPKAARRQPAALEPEEPPPQAARRQKPAPARAAAPPARPAPIEPV